MEKPLDPLSYRAVLYHLTDRVPKHGSEARTRSYRVACRLPWIEGGEPGTDESGEQVWLGGQPVVYESGDIVVVDDREVPAVCHCLKAMNDEDGAFLDQIRTKAEASAECEDIPGLPYFVPIIPTGLPAEDAERALARAWAEILIFWAETLGARWKIRGEEENELLRRLARESQCNRETMKFQLSFVGLLDALSSLDEPWRGRVGSGKGSRKLEAVPREAGVLGQMTWLAQESLARAKLALNGYGDPATVRPDEETDSLDVSYIDARQRPGVTDVADLARRGPSLAETIDAATPRQAEIVEAVSGHLLGDCEDILAAKKCAARDFGISLEAIDMSLLRLARRFTDE